LAGPLGVFVNDERRDDGADAATAGAPTASVAVAAPPALLPALLLGSSGVTLPVLIRRSDWCPPEPPVVVVGVLELDTGSDTDASRVGS